MRASVPECSTRRLVRRPRRPRPTAGAMPARAVAVESVRDRAAAPQQGRLRDPRHPRRLRAGRDDRVGDPADLRDLDLQAGRRGRVAGRLRVQPLRQPDPHRPRGQHRRPRGGGARLRVRQRARGRGHPDPGAVPARGPRGHPRRRVRRDAPALRQGRAELGAGRTAPRRSPTSTPSARPSVRAAPGWSGSRRPPTRCSTSATSRRSRPSPTTPARCWSSTTPSPRRTSRRR